MPILDSTPTVSIQPTPEQIKQQQLAQDEGIHYETNPQAGYSPTPLPVSEEFHIFRLDSGDIIEDFMAWLEGKMPSYQGKKKVFTEVSPPQLNKNGVVEMTSILASFLNKNIYLGCLKEETMMIRMNGFMKDLAYLMRLRYNGWGLHKSKRSMLLRQVCDLAESALSRSWNGREADQLSTAISRIEHTNIETKPQQPNLLSPQRWLSRRER